VSAIINIKTMILNHFHYEKFPVWDATLYYWVSSFRHFEELQGTPHSMTHCYIQNTYIFTSLLFYSHSCWHIPLNISTTII